MLQHWNAIKAATKKPKLQLRCWIFFSALNFKSYKLEMEIIHSEINTTLSPINRSS